MSISFEINKIKQNNSISTSIISEKQLVENIDKVLEYTEAFFKSPSIEISHTAKAKDYYDLLAQNDMEEPREFVKIEKRRMCGTGRASSIDTIELAETVTEKGLFITKEEIIEEYSLKFLRNSPFVKKPSQQMEIILKEYDQNPFVRDPFSGETINFFDKLINGLQKQLGAIAITENGKHVILQQAIKSCVPSCVGMLVLDHGKTPNYRAIEITNLANDEQAMEWIEEVGLTPKLIRLAEHKSDKALFLSQCLYENGPGILGINHPGLGAHDVVLDAISLSENTAVIRDPFHGRVIKMKLDCLMSWVDKFATFLQISQSVSDFDVD